MFNKPRLSFQNYFPMAPRDFPNVTYLSDAHTRRGKKICVIFDVVLHEIVMSVANEILDRTGVRELGLPIKDIGDLSLTQRADHAQVVNTDC